MSKPLSVFTLLCPLLNPLIAGLGLVNKPFVFCKTPGAYLLKPARPTRPAAPNAPSPGIAIVASPNAVK